jgi:hypothetical protein
MPRDETLQCPVCLSWFPSAGARRSHQRQKSHRISDVEPSQVSPVGPQTGEPAMLATNCDDNQSMHTNLDSLNEDPSAEPKSTSNADQSDARTSRQIEDLQNSIQNM